MPSKKPKGGTQEFAVFTGSFYGSDEASGNAASLLKNSVERFGREMIVFKGPCNSLWDAKITKIIPLLKDLDHKYLMWVDASDAFCARDPMMALSVFKRTKKDILISAEANCFPEQSLMPLFPEPLQNGPEMRRYRFLNSGVYIGTRKKIMEYLDRVREMQAEGAEKGWQHIDNDQTLWSRLFVEREKRGASMALDTRCDMSVSTYLLESSLFYSGKDKKGRKCLRVSGVEGTPVIVHINGWDKGDAEKIAHLKRCADLNV